VKTKNTQPPATAIVKKKTSLGQKENAFVITIKHYNHRKITGSILPPVLTFPGTMQKTKIHSNFIFRDPGQHLQGDSPYVCPLPLLLVTLGTRGCSKFSYQLFPKRFHLLEIKVHEKQL
jgi:hypothetical protein